MFIGTITAFWSCEAYELTTKVTYLSGNKTRKRCLLAFKQRGLIVVSMLIWHEGHLLNFDFKYKDASRRKRWRYRSSMLYLRINNGSTPPSLWIVRERQIMLEFILKFRWLSVTTSTKINKPRALPLSKKNQER